MTDNRRKTGIKSMKAALVSVLLLIVLSTGVLAYAAEDTAKAATPIQAQKGFPYWVLIILAAVAGVSVEEYVRRRNAKANSDSSKKN